MARNVFRVIATVLSGAIWLLYKYSQRVGLDLFPDTAAGAALDRIGLVFGVARTTAETWQGTAKLLKAATSTVYTAPKTGNNI